MAVSFAFVMGLSAGFAQTGSSAIGVAVVPFLFIVHLFYDVGYIAMNYSYTVEIMVSPKLLAADKLTYTEPLDAN